MFLARFSDAGQQQGCLAMPGVSGPKSGGAGLEWNGWEEDTHGYLDKSACQCLSLCLCMCSIRYVPDRPVAHSCAISRMHASASRSMSQHVRLATEVTRQSRGNWACFFCQRWMCGPYVSHIHIHINSVPHHHQCPPTRTNMQVRLFRSLVCPGVFGAARSMQLQSRVRAGRVSDSDSEWSEHVDPTTGQVVSTWLSVVFFT